MSGPGTVTLNNGCKLHDFEEKIDFYEEWVYYLILYTTDEVFGIKIFWIPEYVL